MISAREKILVLRTFKHGESDMVVHGLNPLGARMNFFAKGAMRSRKRFAGGILEATHYIEVTYKPKHDPDGDPLHLLLEASMIREFPKLRTDYDRLESALYLLRLVAKLGQQGTIDSPELFNLLGNALQACEESKNLDNLKLQFELKVLSAQGVLPPEEVFAPWVTTTLASHEKLEASGPQRHWLLTEAHNHLRNYLGTF